MWYVSMTYFGQLFIKQFTWAGEISTVVENMTHKKEVLDLDPAGCFFHSLLSSKCRAPITRSLK